MAPEGLKLTLSALPRGLTVDAHGRKLLNPPFVFQCPPLEEFKVTRAFTSPDYDTVAEGQFTRQGGRQLRLWSFDTLAMVIGTTVPHHQHHRQSPGWVPFPHFDDRALVTFRDLITNGLPGPPRPSSPEWYLHQLAHLESSGAPFHFSAAYSVWTDDEWETSGPILSTPARLLGFDEVYKAGEGDAIYLQNIQFKEWRDPTVSERALGTHNGHASDTPPTTVRLMQNGRCVTRQRHVEIPSWTFADVLRRDPPECTLVELAKYFYHDPHRWRDIARANHLKKIGGNTPLIDSHYYRKKVPKGGTVIKIPKVLFSFRDVVYGHGPGGV